MKLRYKLALARLNRLLDSMLYQELSSPEKINSLAADLNAYHNTKRFSKYKHMGRILKSHLSLMLGRSEEHTSELQSRPHLVCRLLLEKKKKKKKRKYQK